MADASLNELFDRIRYPFSHDENREQPGEALDQLLDQYPDVAAQHTIKGSSYYLDDNPLARLNDQPELTMPALAALLGRSDLIPTLVQKRKEHDLPIDGKNLFELALEPTELGEPDSARTITIFLLTNDYVQPEDALPALVQTGRADLLGEALQDDLIPVDTFEKLKSHAFVKLDDPDIMRVIDKQADLDDDTHEQFLRHVLERGATPEVVQRAARTLPNTMLNAQHLRIALGRPNDEERAARLGMALAEAGGPERLPEEDLNDPDQERLQRRHKLFQAYRTGGEEAFEATRQTLDQKKALRQLFDRHSGQRQLLGEDSRIDPSMITQPLFDPAAFDLDLDQDRASAARILSEQMKVGRLLEIAAQFKGGEEGEAEVYTELQRALRRAEAENLDIRFGSDKQRRRPTPTEAIPAEPVRSDHLGGEGQ